MNNYWQYYSESYLQGPRCFEIPFVVNNIKEGNSLEIGANLSLFKWFFVRRGYPFTLIDPIGANFNNGKNNPLATCIKEDIRKKTSKELGTFTNVLLVSVLEHIGLGSYKQEKSYSPIKEQLKTFRHCMSFVKKTGRMICTLPYSVVKQTTELNFLLKYNYNMIQDLYKGYNLVDEKFYILTKPIHLDRWKEVSRRETEGHRGNICFVLEHK
jgi:hypothetical protein